MSKHDEMVQIHDLTMQTIANNRRSEARGNALQLHAENLELRRTISDLMKKNEELRDVVKAASSVIREELRNDAALRETINHVRDTWKQDSPQSTARQEVETTINEFYKRSHDAKLLDQKYRDLAEQRIQKALVRIRQDAKEALFDDVF